MNNMKKSQMMMFVVGLICFIVAPLSAMKPTSQKFTIKSTRMLQQVQPTRYKSEVVWVKTSDNVIVGIPQWQIDQMKVLQVLFLQQKGQNSEKMPIDASMISYENLMLMQKALNIAGNLGEFALFCENLMPEQKANLTSAAFTLEAIGLAALLEAQIFSPEIQEKLGASIVQEAGVIYPVVQYLQDPENSKIVFKGQKNRGVTCAAFSPDGNYIVSGSVDHTNNLILWDCKTGEQIKILKGHACLVRYVAFSPDGNYIISRSETYSNNLILWNGKGELIKIFEVSDESSWVTCAAFSPDGNYIISGSWGNENTLILWNGRTGEKIKVLDNNGVNSVAFSPDSNYIVSGLSSKSVLILWNCNTGKRIKVLTGHGKERGQGSISCVAFSPDGNYIVSGSRSKKNNLILWDGKTGEQIKVLEGCDGWVQDVAFSPDGNYIVAGSDGVKNNLLLWDISPIVIKNRLPHILFSLKNYQIDLLPEDIALLIVQNLVELSKLNITYKVLEGCDKRVNRVAFSSDGKYIISDICGEQNLILWDVRTGKIVKIGDLGGAVKCLALSPDSRSIVCTGGDGGNDLILFKLINPQALNFISTQLDIAQARFLYRLYLGKINNVPVVLDKSDPDYQLYLTLPSNVQQLIKSFFPFEEASVFVEKTKKEKLASTEKAIQEKINYYKSSFKTIGATFDEKIKTLKILMQDFDKNSADYKACERLLIELEQEAAFEV